ncbi:MAG: hypothetical protein ACYC6Y_12935 [Thermoguttaceae bacterium]
MPTAPSMRQVFSRELRADTSNARKNRKDDGYRKPARPPVVLSRSEQAVLGVFRDYLMSPGKMLCFSSAGLQAFRMSLARLSEKGFLVPETFRGAYTLTETGFAAMKDCS